MKRKSGRSRRPLRAIYQQPIFWLFLFFLLAYRLFFGLAGEFWFEDELQVYLVGLKAYTTGTWPYFGPDVTYRIQVPGALQGLLGGLPFRALPVPEAPHLLLNLLSFSSLAWFAWYAGRRLPKLSPWFIWTWVMTAPWALHFSTHVVNPSYVLFAGVLFFIAFLETLPATRLKVLPAWAANGMMGFALFWVMQVHLSWVLLVPFAAFSLYSQSRDREEALGVPVLAFLGGCLVTGSLLIPTFLKYGLQQGLGGTESAVRFNPRNMGDFFTILGRTLSFASFELTRFVGANAASRLAFFRENLWLVLPALFVGAVGFLQPAVLLIQPLVQFFVRARRRMLTRDWKAVQLLGLASFLLIWVFFWFSVKRPAAHTYYLLFPVIMLQSLYVWDPHLRKPFWRRFAAAFLACGILYHAGYAVVQLPKRSLYRDRARVVEALKAKDYRLLAERRPGTWY